MAFLLGLHLVVLLEWDFILYLAAGFGAALGARWLQFWDYSNVYFPDLELQQMVINVFHVVIAVMLVKWGLM